MHTPTGSSVKCPLFLTVPKIMLHWYLD